MRLSQPSSLVIFIVCLFCMQTVYSRRGGNKKKKNAAPKWKANSRPATGNNIESITEGDDLSLSCPATGKPKPDITWYKDSHVIDISFDDRMKIKKYNFEVQDAHSTDKGNYTCRVENDRGFLEFTFIVDVIVRIWPLEIAGPQNLTVREGDTAIFHCQALNDPDAQIKWLRRQNSSTVGQNGDRPSSFVETVVNPEELVIENVTLDHAGTYTCLVGNYYGLQYHEAWLSVIPLPTTTTSTTTTLRPTTPKPTTAMTTPRPTIVDPETTEKPDVATTPKPHRHGGRNKGRNRGKSKKDKKDRKKDRQNNRRKQKNKYEVSTTTPDVFEEDVWETELENEMPGAGYENIDNEENVTEPGSAAAQDEDKISVWTIYIIVGAVAGGILLIGLVSILVAICCQKEDGGDYKSTSV